jgi:photosystem II stability/assembly factor-like uncharacterized protein
VKRAKFVLATAVLALASAVASASATAGVTLTHVHGLAYSSDGKRLWIPSHHGLAVYEDGKWSKAPGPEHDYMGFTATRSFLFSSGHPTAGSGLINPFGLIRSRDGGRSWEKLGLEGESDFHVLAAGYQSNAVYVFNPHRNSRMPEPGIYSTLNSGFTWQRAKAQGLAGGISALAVHPTDPKTVAAATDSGVYLSKDSGATFAAVATEGQGLAVFFDLDGRRLWYSSYAGQPRLARVDISTRKNAPVPIPALTNDAVAYVAQNPKRPGEYAIATFERSVYVSRDGGKTWTQIADHGSGL